MLLWEPEAGGRPGSSTLRFKSSSHLAPSRGRRTLGRRWVGIMGPDASRLGAPDQGRGSNVPAARDHRAGKVQAQTAGLGPAGQGRAGGAPAARARRRSLPRSGRGSLCKSGRTCPGSGLRSSGPPLHFLLLPALRSPLAQPRTAASATAAVTLAAHPHPSCKPSRAEPYRAPPRQRPSASEPGPASRGWGQQNPAPGPASGKGGACGVLPGGSPRGWAARANGRWRRGGTLLSVDRCGWRRTMKATRSRGAGRLGSRMEGEARVPGLTATEHEASGGRGRGLEESGMGWDVLGWRSPGPGVIVPASCSSPLLGLRAQSCSGEL